VLFALAPLFDVTIRSYTLFDLPEACALQHKYITRLSETPGTPSRFHPSRFDFRLYDDASDLSVVAGTFMVSNYCLSEVAPDVRDRYVRETFPNVAHFWGSWNFFRTNPVPPTFYDQHTFHSEPEFPLTGPNRDVRF
jgi:hypothetical protein